MVYVEIVVVIILILIYYDRICLGLFRCHRVLNKRLRYAYQDNKTSEAGFWTDDQRDSHITSQKLKSKLLMFYQRQGVNDVLDCGCGDASYVKYLRDNEVNAIGIDRNNKLIGEDYYVDADLSIPLDLKMIGEYSQSFEVGEHIPYANMGVFINNICNHSTRGVIISWALEGQGGDGHINEQNNERIISEFGKRGFVYDEISSRYFKNEFYGLYFMYFSDSIMVFKRRRYVV